MIDICTVVFRDEIPTLKVQAASLEQYCSKIGIRNIYVVLNDDEALAAEIDPAWWGSLAQYVLVVPRTTFSTAWVENGWLSQQLFKILTASISYNKWTMVLDAKTMFVRELNLEDLGTPDGRLTVGTLPIYDVFKPAKDIVDQLFGIDMQTQIGPGGVPFFFHNDTVRYMIAEVTERTQQSFPEWFQRQGMLTEFMLYSGYVQHKFGTQNLTEQNALGNVINICHSEVDQFDSKLASMQNPHTLTVSVHRNAWRELTAEQKNAYRMFLIDRNIIPAHSL
jgi:hypothetical protein